MILSKKNAKKRIAKYIFSITGSGVCEVELEIEFIPKNRADCWQELVDIENYLFCGEEPKTKRNFIDRAITFKVTLKG